ncbi:hypothetical protein D918_08342 [Trichuris suis]|nr:hypothetical protein D918_08342 [Trichuris suis]
MNLSKPRWLGCQELLIVNIAMLKRNKRAPAKFRNSLQTKFTSMSDSLWQDVGTKVRMMIYKQISGMLLLVRECGGLVSFENDCVMHQGPIQFVQFIWYRGCGIVEGKTTCCVFQFE